MDKTEKAGKTRLKKNDNVVVIAGKEKGKRGRILFVDRDKGRVIVEGVNFVSRHVKAGRNSANPQGGIIRQEGSLSISNVMYLHDGKPTRIGYRHEKGTRKDKNGNTIEVMIKKRFAKTSGALID